MPWGSHACQFYETADDLLEIAIPFIRAGLAGGETCLWLACDPVGADAALAALRGAFLDADRLLERGDIEINECRAWLAPDGHFDPVRAVDLCRERRARALAAGYAGFRLHANVAWIDEATSAAYAEFERNLDESLAGERAIVLCTYPLTVVNGAQVFDVAGTHDFTIGRRDGRWEVLENADLAGIKQEIERRNEALEAGLADRTRELLQTQTALLRSEEIYALLAEHTTDIVTLYDVDRQRVYVSPAYRKLLGDVPERIFADVHPDERQAMESGWQRVLDGEHVVLTVRHRHVDGSWRWLDVSASLVPFRGRPHVLVIKRDVSEQRRLQEEMRQAQKLEAIGRLAGGIAHDFNNLLTAILGYTDLVLEDIPAESRAVEDIGEIRMAAERARGVTRQLLAFSRRQVLQPQVVDVNAVVRGIQRMLGLLLREDIRFEVRTADRPLLVRVDPIQLEQVLMNLVVNARDAVGPGGHVTVECGALSSTSREPDPPAAGYATVRVTDDGIGMTPEIEARVFEPFFTTKPIGVGTGLGLATVYGIVRDSGGQIWLETRLGKGTRFTVALPIVEGEATEDAPEAPARAHALEGRAVVVAEDEGVVRHFIFDSLTRAGMQVHAFATPADALAIVENRTVRIDAMITDLILPGMTGVDLAERAHAVRPDLPVIYISGYTKEEVEFSQSADLERMLAKPFGTKALIEQLAAALG